MGPPGLQVSVGGEGRAGAKSAQSPATLPRGGLHSPLPPSRPEDRRLRAHLLPAEPACPDGLGSGGGRAGTRAVSSRIRCQAALEHRTIPARISWEKFTSEKSPLVKCWGSGVLPWGPETMGPAAPRSLCLLQGRRAECRACPRRLGVLTAQGSGAGCSVSHHLGRGEEGKELEPGSWGPGRTLTSL